MIEAARKEALELRQNLRDIETALLDARHERYELRRHPKSLDEGTRSARGLEDAQMRITHDDERDEEQLKRNERKRQVVPDSSASLDCTLHAADTERTYQHERLLGWLLFRLRALDVLVKPL